MDETPQGGRHEAYAELVKREPLVQERQEVGGGDGSAGANFRYVYLNGCESVGVGVGVAAPCPARAARLLSRPR